MVNIYLSEQGVLQELDTIVPGAWVNLCAPTEEELAAVGMQLGIEADMLHAALDEEERSRIEVEEEATLILVDTPTVESQQGRGFVYSTIPFGIILTQNNIITVCLKESALGRVFSESPVKNFSTKKKNRFTLQLLYRNASQFLFYLREVDRAANRVENALHLSMQNKELIQMLALEKSLVYFSTSLKSNEIVLEKMLRMDFVRDFPDDTELLEDVIIENKQAIEMCSIYRDIQSGTMDAFASVISNNLNIVMKFLASLTIILTIPTIVFGFWGSNVHVPFENSPFGALYVLAIAVALTGGATYIMIRRKWM